MARSATRFPKHVRTAPARAPVMVENSMRLRARRFSEFAENWLFSDVDGFSLYETLDCEIPLNHVRERKVRRAAEADSPFIRVRDLFPH